MPTPPPAEPSQEPEQVPSTAEEPTVERWPSGAARGIQKLSYTHDALVDLIVAEPHLRQYELAARFGFSPSWICQVIASDAFQARLAERKNEIVDPAIRENVEQQFQVIIRRSLAVLMEKLDRPSKEIPDNLALRAFEVGSRVAGYGAKPEAPKVQVNVVNHLEDLGTNLELLLKRKRLEVVDAEVTSGDALAGEHPTS